MILAAGVVLLSIMAVDAMGRGAVAQGAAAPQTFSQSPSSQAAPSTNIPSSTVAPPSFIAPIESNGGASGASGPQVQPTPTPSFFAPAINTVEEGTPDPTPIIGRPPVTPEPTQDLGLFPTPIGGQGQEGDVAEEEETPFLIDNPPFAPTPDQTEVSAPEATPTPEDLAPEPAPAPVLAPAGVGTPTNPASIAQALRAFLFASGDPFVELEASIIQVSRGGAAEQSLGSVLTLINPAPEGEEYLIASVRVAFLPNPAFSQVTVGLESFRLSTTEGDRQAVAISRPDPAFPQSIFPGNAIEGWLAFLVPANDSSPELGLVGATFSGLFLDVPGGGAWWSLG